MDIQNAQPGSLKSAGLQLNDFGVQVSAQETLRDGAWNQHPYEPRPSGAQYPPAVVQYAGFGGIVGVGVMVGVGVIVGVAVGLGSAANVPV